MAGDHNPTARALIVLELLQDNPGITAQRLAERLGVSERAARRCIATLRDADIPIESTRGPYGGCVGYFSFNGNLDCCITIRTALLKDGKAYVQAGGGWVNDSTPEGEFQETVNKAKAMLAAVALAESFGQEAS